MIPTRMQSRTHTQTQEQTLLLLLLMTMTFSPIALAQNRVVIPPGFENTEADALAANFPAGFHYQQLAPATWFASLPSGPQVIETISFRPSIEVNEPLDLAPAHLTLKLSTTDRQPDGLSLLYAENHGQDVLTVYDAPWAVQSQATTSANGITKDFDVNVQLAEPFAYDRSQGNLLIDVLYQPIDEQPIPDSLTDFSFGDFTSVTGLPEAIHQVSHTGPPQPQANTTWTGGNIYELGFAPSNQRPIFARKQNVGPNSGMDAFEFVPTVSADGLTLLFSSDTLPGGLGSEEMWMATRSSVDEPFGDVVHLGDVNSPRNDDVGSLSSDNLTLYFGSDRDTSGDWDIYTATRASVDEPFGNVMPLAGPINQAGRIENSPRISSDGLTMVYQVGELRDLGDSDIWIATRASTDEAFSAPRRLEIGGDDVEEWWPTLSSDGLTLVLSDQPGQPLRPGGEGAEDIWVAVRDNLSETFSAPQNPDTLWPGSQVNSGNRTAYPFLSSDWPELGSQLYFIETQVGQAGLQADVYQMTWLIPKIGDVNLDGWEDVTDLNDMCRQVASSRPDDGFDLNGDDAVTLADMHILQTHLDVVPGDTDFDGAVTFTDFLTLSDRFGKSSRIRTRWSTADFNCDGETDFADFLLLSQNFRETVEVARVPEASSRSLVMVAGVVVLVRGRRRLGKDARRQSDVARR